jgi:trimethylamine--corrinoid protein Co-methyltransferase
MRRNARGGGRKSGGFRLEVFTSDELQEIHLATLEVLSQTGVVVEDEEALATFEDGGATVDSERKVVRLPAHVVEDALHSAPPKVVMCGRSPERDVVLEDGRVGFTNFGEGIQVVDPHTGELHESRKQDAADCTKIIDALPEIDVVERPLGAHDVPQDTASLHNAEAIFTNTTKPRPSAR